MIRSGPGDDDVLSPAIGQLDGGGGADLISGGTGSDDLNDGPVSDASMDRLRGDEGNDFIITANRPNARGFVDCGAGRKDFAAADRKDTVRDNCERVKRFTPKPPPPGPVPID